MVQNANEFPLLVKEKIFPLSNLKSERIDGLRKAAVLMPFFFEENQWKLLFIHRANVGEFHRGEVAFPGGGEEKVDNTLVDTVLRETYEELGIHSKFITIAGFLPPLTTISKYYVTPFIGFINWPIQLKINSFEVEKVFSISVDWLGKEQNWEEREVEIEKKGKIKTIFYKPYDEENLWGLTARITRAFFELIK